MIRQSDFRKIAPGSRESVNSISAIYHLSNPAVNLWPPGAQDIRLGGGTTSFLLSLDIFYMVVHGTNRSVTAFALEEK